MAYTAAYMGPFLRNIRAVFQLCFALLITVALAVQFAYGGFKGGFTFPYFALFFSYFTILSNILVSYILYKEARASLRRKQLSARLEWMRAFAVFCIVATGITYTFFLRGPAAMITIQDSLSWTNQVFHHVMPIVMTVDWILFPPKRKVKWISILYWILLTAIYAIFAVLLGMVSHVYPYFFFDPNRLHGYSHVLRASLGFVPFFLVFGLLIVGTNKIRTRRI